MEIIDKTRLLEIWLTPVLGLLFVLIFLLKVSGKNLLKQQVTTIFKVPFVPLESEDNFSVFNPYQILVFLFTTVVFSIFATFFYGFKLELKYVNFSLFSLIFGGVFAYFLLKWLLEYLLSNLFLVKRQLKLFIISKWNYLFSIAFYLYVLFLLHTYAGLHTKYLYSLAFIFITLRTLFVVFTNKKLIFSKLFYFILYLCASEIAPLFILFKLMF